MVENDMANEIVEALAGTPAEEIETLIITGDANIKFNDCRAIRANFSNSSVKKR